MVKTKDPYDFLDWEIGQSLVPAETVVLAQVASQKIRPGRLLDTYLVVVWKNVLLIAWCIEIISLIKHLKT